jgi:hypothetical protein
MTPAGTPDVKARVGRLLARQARNTRAVCACTLRRPRDNSFPSHVIYIEYTRIQTIRLAPASRRLHLVDLPTRQNGLICAPELTSTKMSPIVCLCINRAW